MTLIKPPPGLPLMDAARIARQLGGRLVAVNGRAYIRQQSPDNLVRLSERARHQSPEDDPTPPEAA